MTSGEANQKIITHELAPGVDIKLTISEMLKRVDNCIRKGELEQAEEFVTRAREIDPKNIYAYAFQERIVSLREQAQQNTIRPVSSRVIEETTQGLSHFAQNPSVKTAEERPKLSLEPTVNTQTVSFKQPVATLAAATGPDQKQRTIVQSEKSVVKPIQMATNPEGPMDMSRANTQDGAEDPRKVEEATNFKIQQMIKSAFEATRKEVEMKQEELRAKQQELARQEEARIKEVAEAAQKAEEQRRAELKHKSEEVVQQKIKQALQRKNPPEHVAEPQARVLPSVSPSIPPQETRSPKVTQPEIPVSPDRQRTLDRYKLVLSSVWTDGAVSEAEDATLAQLRQSLSISVEEHARLEKEVQRDTYIEAFKKAWNSGTVTPENASVLAELRQRFKITNEEHLSIESRILWELQPLKNRPTLLIIDDDEKLLKAVAKTLTEAGFITTSVTTSDEAYAYLKESSPDLILCDVNLETSTMGGFTFYEKVREFERLRETPFIFLSGLSDEALVRTGKELGADDYLSKPVSEETLVATIKGKLRRYHDLKKRVN